jgi:hypothetical protein
MMSDDLKQNLRGSCFLAFEDGTNDYETAPEAADRIEELEAQLSNVSFELNTAVRLLAAAGDGLRLMVRVEMAEAKLAKAVDFVLRSIRYAGNSGDDFLADKARTTLAELKGEQP